MKLVPPPRRLLSVLMFGLAISVAGVSSGAEDPLLEGFANPPNAAKPRVWWHWLNGNISKEGITLDLEWMKRIGIGGAESFQGFLGPMGPGKAVEKQLPYMSEGWRDAFHHAAVEADRLGLELGIAASPGWSETGGPWVQPFQAMKKFVWSEMFVTGGTPFRGTLPKPPDIVGPFQALPLEGFQSGMVSPALRDAKFYADSAVVAFPASEDDGAPYDRPAVAANAGQVDAAALADRTLGKPQLLPMAPPGQPSWIRFDYSHPVTIRALTVMVGGISSMPGFGTAPPAIGLEASDDGQDFHAVLPPKVLRGSVFGIEPIPVTVAVKPTNARHFRVLFVSPQPQPPMPPIYGPVVASATAWSIGELALHSDPRVDRAEDKAGFVPAIGLDESATPDAGIAIPRQGVIDLTGKMRTDGTMDWVPPPGRWVVLRIGYSLLGITNHPAPTEATGLEVDKLNRTYVKDYLDTYLGQYRKAAQGLMGARGLTAITNDSWEDGSQNWTDDILDQFQKRRGYDPRPWLPVLTGRVVENAAASDRFLWDFRATLADLVVDAHYHEIARAAKEVGLVHYGESHEGGRVLVGDGMVIKRDTDIPMGAMWTQSPGVYAEQYQYDADIRESASVAHIYGQNLVAAESMTATAAPFGWSPETLKPVVDKELAMGVNRVVIHTSVHQPLVDKAPGLSLGIFGQWFTRNETWAEQAKPWIDYIARSDFMLQQGHSVADVLYFYGEDSNITAIFGDHAPAVPSGYNFDYVNADALMHALSVEHGAIMTPGGTRYRVIVLDPRAAHMSVPVLRALHALVEAGAVVVGGKPVDTPSLADDPTEFTRLAEAVWGAGDRPHVLGKGRVIPRLSIGDALEALGIQPDLDFAKTGADVLYVHRQTQDADIYYIDNRRDRPVSLTPSFRVAGREAEIWHADSGESEPASYSITQGRTTVPLALRPYEAVFVVFRKPAKRAARSNPVQQESVLSAMDGAWAVSFDKGPCAPEPARIEHLQSWSESADLRVKYFSGTATYRQTVQVPPDWRANEARIFIDLGAVKNLAEITVNGKSLGTVWKPPFRVDATAALKRGENTLAVKVTDLWVNRLIGDLQPGAARCAFAEPMPLLYQPGSPLVPAGLLGPVRLIRVHAGSRGSPF